MDEIDDPRFSKPLHVFSSGAESLNQIRRIAFDPKSDRLAACGYDNKLTLYDTTHLLSKNTTNKTSVIASVESRSSESLYSLCYARDSSFVAVGGGDFINMHSPDDAKLLQTIDGAHYGNVYSIDCRSDSKAILGGFGDGRFAIYDTDTGVATSIIHAHSQSIEEVRYFDDNLVVTGSDDNDVCLFDLREKHSVQKMKTNVVSHTGMVRSVAVCPEKYLIASGGHSKQVFVHDIRNLVEPQNTFDSCEWGLSLHFASASTLLCGTSGDTVHVYDLAHNQQMMKPFRSTSKESGGWVWSILTTPVTDNIIVAHSDGKIRVFEGLSQLRWERKSFALLVRYHSKNDFGVAFEIFNVCATVARFL